MKKFPKPWYRSSRGLRYVTLDGVQHNLGPDKDAAFKQYKQLLVQPEQTTASCHTVALIVDAILDWSQKHQAERTYFRYRDYCQSFVNLFPERLVAELKPGNPSTFRNGLIRRQGGGTRRSGARLSR